MKKNSVYDRVVRLFLPVGAIAVIAGIINDLIVPLAQLGIWFGIFTFSIGLMLLLVSDSSRLGIWLKKLSRHWKMPLVCVFLFLGIATLVMAEISARYEEENGYLASNYELIQGMQLSILSIVGQANTIRDTAQETSEAMGQTDRNLALTKDNLRNTAEDELYQLGHSVTDVDQIFSIFTGYQSDALKMRLQLLHKTEYDLYRSVRPYSYWGKAASARMNEIARLPRRMRLADGLVALELPVSVWEEILTYFPELVSDSSISTRGYALEDYPYSRPPNLQYGFISVRNGAELPRHDEIRGGYTLLHTSVALNSLISADALLKLNADVNVTSTSGYTPLALASEHGSFEIARLLIQHGADPAAHDWLAVEIALLRASQELTRQFNQVGTPTMKYLTVEHNEYIKFAEELLNGQPLPNNVRARTLEYYRRFKRSLNSSQKKELQRYMTRVEGL